MNNTRHTSRITSSTMLLASTAALLAGCAAPSTAGPAASATPSPTPVANGCLREDGGCLGVLSPGTYESQSFTAFDESSPGQLIYTVSDDSWANALDHTPAYWFQEAEPYAAGSGDDFLPGVYVWADVAAAAQDYPACPETSEPTGPTDASGLLSWIAQLPGLTATPLTDVQVGDLSVNGLDIVIDLDTAPSCSWGVFVSLIAARDNAPDPYMWGIGNSERMHIYLADLGDDNTAAVIVDAPATQFDHILPAAQELISTFEFVAP